MKLKLEENGKVRRFWSEHGYNCIWGGRGNGKSINTFLPEIFFQKRVYVRRMIRVKNPSVPPPTTKYREPGPNDVMLMTFKLYFIELNCRDKTIREEGIQHHAIIGEEVPKQNGIPEYLPFHYKGRAIPVTGCRNRFLINGFEYEYQSRQGGFLAEAMGNVLDDGQEKRRRDPSYKMEVMHNMHTILIERSKQICNRIAQCKISSCLENLQLKLESEYPQLLQKGIEERKKG